MAKVLIKQLTKRFGKVIAAKDFNLKAEDKQFIVLLGPSGCGKTTVLRCIAGLETPDEGEIYIGERLVNDLEPAERDIAMVFQTYALYPHMTVFQNLSFPLENAKVPEAEIKAKVEKTANLLRIGNLLQRRPKQLSGGQRQRVALGRAMVREPQVFLMDEPLSNLDAKLRVYMRAELKKLQKDLGITTIYVTHDQVEAMTMGDKVAIMNEGILQQVGSANEIYFHPANVFVAGFIGTPPTNLIECTLSKGKTHVLDAKSFKYSLPQAFHEKARDWPELLVLGIRPQDVVVHAKPPENEVIKARFDIDEPLGDRRILDLSVGEILVKALVSPDFEASVGDNLWIEFPSDKVFIFDKETGKNLT